LDWGLGRLPFLDLAILGEEGKPLPIPPRLVVGQRHPDHPVLAVAVPKGQFLPAPRLPLMVHVLVPLLHHLVGPVEVVVGEAAVHLLLPRPS
jgi:hypothetical protein